MVVVVEKKKGELGMLVAAVMSLENPVDILVHDSMVLSSRLTEDGAGAEASGWRVMPMRL